MPGFNIPSSTREPKGILGFNLLFSIVSKYSSSITLAFFIRSLAALKYFLSLSIPKYFLPNFLATTAVVSKKLGRNYYGIEKDKKYFVAAKERINKTETIADEYLDTIENNKSKPRIPFGSLVELGIIKPGTSLFDQKKKINAKIMADGSIKYKDTEGSIHKIAAKIMGAESYNGWTYWHYNLNGSTVPIDNLRQKFIAGNQI